MSTVYRHVDVRALPYPIRGGGFGIVRTMESNELRPQITATVTAMRFGALDPVRRAGGRLRCDPA